MKFNDQLMKNALIRINELQEEIIQKSKNISGAEDFVKQKLELYEEDERIRAIAKDINLQEKQITDNFFNK
ncbi:hypothetical protein AACT_2202 [Arcobacter acticola]|uniref:Uncharacterized protein n=1 Tax=Arcobacter acticola TaxID=1849015 RepID=A0A6M8EMM3_9BACT|nr:hypothetical protein [Arcobacter acticola]QKE29329.1 hypothetical protein AACT_2202 [Arcobacter acticola]